MIKYNQSIRILIIFLLSFISLIVGVNAQESNFNLSGVVIESGSGEPVKQAVISVTSNGEFTNTDENGEFSLSLPSVDEIITVSYPGYYITDYYTSGQQNITIYLTKIGFNSNNQQYVGYFGAEKLADASNAVTLLSKSVFERSASTSIEQNISARVPGLHVVEHSGMPGHNSWINLRGISSMYGRNQPVVIIDGYDS